MLQNPEAISAKGFKLFYRSSHFIALVILSLYFATDLRCILLSRFTVFNVLVALVKAQ